MIYWNLCERFGWTLEYAKSISMGDLRDLNAIDDAKIKAR